MPSGQAPDAEVSVAVFGSAQQLPASALRLLDADGSMFVRPAWWRVVEANAMPVGSVPLFVVCLAGGVAVGVFPLLRQRSGRLHSLTTPYTCRYAPVLAADLDATARVAVMTAFARFCRGRGVVRLDALAAEWDGLADLLAGARRVGLRSRRFDHFGNWHEAVGGLDWAAYLAGRPGALRETIRRRLRRASRLPEARFTLLTGAAGTDAAAAAFEAVYARSWKQPEPFPAFNAALIRSLGESGLLRFGLWSLGEAPVAVQVWMIEADRRATVLKLAHDEAFKAHSPGTVLTALVLQRLLDQEQVTGIDFGRGDDQYKQGWATQRRQRIGLLLVNPWHPAGALQLARHALGRARAALRRPR